MVSIRECVDTGLVDVEHLKEQLALYSSRWTFFWGLSLLIWHYCRLQPLHPCLPRPLLMGSFSAASNVTGALAQESS